MIISCVPSLWFRKQAQPILGRDIPGTRISLYSNAAAAVMIKVGFTFFQKMVYNYKITGQLC
jgi:hypothetical protein